MAERKDSTYSIRINGKDWRRIKAEAVVRSMGVGEFVSVLYAEHCEQGKCLLSQPAVEQLERQEAEAQRG